MFCSGVFSRQSVFNNSVTQPVVSSLPLTEQEAFLFFFMGADSNVATYNKNVANQYY